jgi:hypothetical protein
MVPFNFAREELACTMFAGPELETPEMSGLPIAIASVSACTRVFHPDM